MHVQHTKFWLTAFVLTISAAGGAASYAAKNTPLYRGEVTLAEAEAHKDESEFFGKIAQASVLDFGEVAPREVAPEAVSIAALNQTPEQTPPPAPAPSPKRSLCEETETAVIRDGEFIGCRPENAAQIQDAAPTKAGGAPKIARIHTAQEGSSANSTAEAPASFTAPKSCESQGLFTYAGPDRPGLLYGMCIACETSEFILNNGKCS